MKNRGFTLIEIIIYTALFSIMMGGLVVTVFELMQNSEKLSGNDTAQEEINFVLKKMDWALSDASDINSPQSGTSEVLSVNKTNFTNNPIVFDLNTSNSNYHYIEFCLKSTNCNPLTTQNVKVENLSFEYLPKAGIKSTITLNGETISTVKYLNK
jgi:prepilin-type N-terminal cleavage/methylation domain-containing protein